MLNAIGSITYGNAPGTGASTAVLESQLAQCERQLSDRVHCGSAKTPEGKDAIQALTNRISEIKARLEKAVVAKSNSHSATLNAKTPANPNKDAAAPIAGVADPAAAPRSANGGVGSLVDVFA
ncbi:MAG TPA: hypothetical protein VMV75_10065 [Sulfuricella sp.]|nr:hypothetical protein [Sulfuricella sp.]